MPALDLSPPTSTSAEPHAAGLAPVQRQRSLAHAARHDILRRLAPALRHDMVVPLQSLGMTAEALNARLERGAIGPEELQTAVSKLNRLTRSAVDNCLRVATWMEPAEDDSVPLQEGVAECTGLLASSLNFRGFQLHSEVSGVALPVSRCALRFLLAASLLSLADHAPGPGAIVVRAEAAADHAVLQVAWRATDEASPTQLHEPGHAALSWTEVQALAALESVELHRGAAQITLRLPRTLVTTPLKMVPV